MLIYTSPDPAHMNGGGSYVAAWRAHHENTYTTGVQTWANAFYTYWPGDIGAFNAEWQSLVTAYPQGIPVLASPKGRPDLPSGATAVHNFCSQLPTAWREKFIIAYWQEPGNNFGDDGQPTIAEFRARVVAMSDIVRGYGLRNAVHVEEWDINPFNNRAGSNEAERFAHLYQFVQGIEDKIDVVSWSLYPGENQSMINGIPRMEAWMNQYMPTHEWRITATSSPVLIDRPAGGPHRTTRANIVRDTGDYIAARTAATGRGPTSFGWFHFTGFAGSNHDNMATTDQQLYDALQYVANLEVSPGGNPGVEAGFVAAAETSTWGNSSMNILIPLDVQNGDVALLFVDGMSNAADSSVSGWTSLGQAVGTQNITSRLFARTLSIGQSGQSVSISLTHADIRYGAQLVVYRGVSLDDIAAQWQLQGGSTTTVTPTVTAPAGAYVVQHVAERANPVGNGFTPPSGVTERIDGGPTFAGVSVRAASGDHVMASAGQAGGGTWTSTITTNHRVGWTVVLPADGASVQTRYVRQSGAWSPRQTRLRASGQWVEP